jgi:hypothetical protein
MPQITADHLARGAFIYVRQSTAAQLVYNQESRRRQYGLADRAKQLGWATVEVVDDDLGRSGAQARGWVLHPGVQKPAQERTWQRISAAHITEDGEARYSAANTLAGSIRLLPRLRGTVQLLG